MFHGSGLYTHMNGDSYAGQFFKNQMHGIGTYAEANGERMSGRFKNGELVELGNTGSSSLSHDVFDMKDQRDLVGATAAADAAGAADTTVYMIHERKKLQQVHLQQQQQQQQQQNQDYEGEAEEQQHHQIHQPSQNLLGGFVQSAVESPSLISADRAYEASTPRAASSLPSPTQSAYQEAMQTPSYKCVFTSRITTITTLFFSCTVLPKRVLLQRASKA